METMDEWVNKMCIYRVECYSVFTKKEMLPYAIAWIHLEDIMLSEMSQT
jgi:hypothetical protein